MAYIYAPRPADRDAPLIWNVNGAVGAPPAQNNREDVLLVQFALHLLSQLSKASPALRAATKAVRITGTIDPETIAAIRAVQEDDRKWGGAIVDGRVSPAKGGAWYAKGGLWTIADLNAVFAGRVGKDFWPRIDRIHGCPGELVQMVRREVLGSM
jgi:hypothetical protein